MTNQNEEIYVGPSVSKVARQNYKRNIGRLLPYLMSFFIILVAVVALAVFFGYSILVTMPLLIIPFYFGFQLVCVDESNSLSLGVGARNYFTPKFSGSYSLGWSLLYSLGIAFLIYLVTSGIYSVVASRFDSSFNEAFNAYYQALMNGDLNTINSIMADASNPLVIMTTIDGIVLYGSFVLIFAHHLFKRGAIPYMLKKFKNLIGGRTANALLKAYLRRRGRNYRNDYYKANWLGILLLVIGLIGGSIGAYFLLPASFSFSLNSKAMMCVVVGIGASCILLIFYFPYYCYVMNELADRYEKDVLEVNAELNREALEYLKQMKEMNDMQARYYEDMIRTHKFDEDNDVTDDDDENDDGHDDGASGNSLDDYGRGDHS